MKILAITRKTLLELLREPLLLGLILAFPVMLVGFYYIAFGQTQSGLATYLHVLVMNQDSGAVATNGSNWQGGEELIQTLRDQTIEGQATFKLSLVSDRQAAETALRERKAALLLVIPPEFSQTLADATSGINPTHPTNLALVGYPSSDTFIFARSFIEGLVYTFAQQAGGQPEPTLSLNYEFLPGTGTMSDFDFGVGGIIIFGIMFEIVSTATVVVRENVNKTLRRLRLSAAGAGDLLLGVGLSQMILAALQMPITFGAAVAMGFKSNGSLLLAMLIGLLVSLTAIGLGLVTACFARNDADAANLGSILMVPVVFLSGALFPMPELPIAVIAGRTIELYDILPTTHASEAMRRVLSLGDGLAAVSFELVATGLLSALILAVGVALYQRFQIEANT